MTEHHHHNVGSRKHTHRANREPHRKRIHKEWRLWVAVSFMLAAVLIYVFTLDDSLLWFAR
jgi:hypothetical protein